jgi:farnesyl diphosphate synthase
LVGDALQVLAFELLTDGPGLPLSTTIRLKLVSLLARASGTQGMAGGQALDLAATGRKLTLPEVEQVHARKTGALIHASVMMAASCSNRVSLPTLQALDDYALAVGLAFQIQDDLLDVEGDSAIIGKATGADLALNSSSIFDCPRSRTRRNGCTKRCATAPSAEASACDRHWSTPRRRHLAFRWIMSTA